MWDLPGPGLEPTSLHWQADSQPLRHQGSPPCENLNLVFCSSSEGTGTTLPWGRPQLSAHTACSSSHFLPSLWHLGITLPHPAPHFPVSRSALLKGCSIFSSPKNFRQFKSAVSPDIETSPIKLGKVYVLWLFLLIRGDRIDGPIQVIGLSCRCLQIMFCIILRYKCCTSVSIQVEMLIPKPAFRKCEDALPCAPAVPGGGGRVPQQLRAEARVFLTSGSQPQVCH